MICYNTTVDYVIEVGRRERKRQAVHQSLLEAAERLFAERGVARTTVDDIADAADVARQTVFNHFPYKEALALELGAQNIQRVAQHAHARLEAGVPALEVLQETAERVLAVCEQRGECAAVVAQELLHTDPERAARAAGRVPLRALFEAILLQAREEGSLRDDLPVEIVAKRISSILTSIVAQIMTTDAEVARRELSVCFDMLFNGISERS
jgi:AcrR family transcriptional regulator